MIASPRRGDLVAGQNLAAVTGTHDSGQAVHDWSVEVTAACPDLAPVDADPDAQGLVGDDLETVERELDADRGLDRVVGAFEAQQHAVAGVLDGRSGRACDDTVERVVVPFERDGHLGRPRVPQARRVDDVGADEPTCCAQCHLRSLPSKWHTS